MPSETLVGDHPLSQLYFYLTEGCNLACRHCWLAPKLDADASRLPVLPVDLFETAIAEARPLGLQSVKLTGGEPLLHPGITQLLEITHREGLRLVLETNGVLCSPDLASRIAATGKPFVSVSLDGVDAATHEWVRGVAGSFEAACAGIRVLAGAGLSPQVIFSVMRKNAHQVDAIVELAESLGAGSVKFNVVQPTARGEKLHEREQTLGIAELIAIGRHVDTVLSRKTPLRLHFDYPPAFRPLSRIASPGGGGVCGIKGIVGVLASGHYALCGIGEAVPDLVFGRVGRDALAEIWETHPVLLGIRDGLPARLTGICASCLVRGRCLGSCVAQNYYRSHDLFAPFWFCEQAQEVGLFPATRRT